jgi:hypothetical protein
MSDILANVAMNVVLTCSCPARKKADKTATSEYVRTMGIASKRASVSKAYFDGDAYQKFQSWTSAMRKEHYRLTYDSDVKGVRVIPNLLVEKQLSIFKEGDPQFLTLRQAFLDSYDEELDRFTIEMNGHGAADFPSKAKCAEQSRFEYKFAPIADTAQLNTLGANGVLSQSVADYIRRTEDDRHNMIVEAAVKDLWTRLYSTVSHMADKLGNPKGDVYDSYRQNIMDVLDVIKPMNITGNPDIDRMADEVRDFVSPSYLIQLCRADDAIKQTTADRAAALAKKIQGYM